VGGENLHVHFTDISDAAAALLRARGSTKRASLACVCVPSQAAFHSSTIELATSSDSPCSGHVNSYVFGALVHTYKRYTLSQTRLGYSTRPPRMSSPIGHKRWALELCSYLRSCEPTSTFHTLNQLHSLSTRAFMRVLCSENPDQRLQCAARGTLETAPNQPAWSQCCSGHRVAVFASDQGLERRSA
jgi:hypothetical protein